MASVDQFGQLVRLVLFDHPHRGRWILMSTDLALTPLALIAPYCYHFWMMAMMPLARCSGNQYLHRKSDDYRQGVRRKLAAYHCYVQTGCIAQGLLQHLARNFRVQVWNAFRGVLVQQLLGDEAFRFPSSLSHKHRHP